MCITTCTKETARCCIFVCVVWGRYKRRGQKQYHHRQAMAELFLSFPSFLLCVFSFFSFFSLFSLFSVSVSVSGRGVAASGEVDGHMKSHRSFLPATPRYIDT
ncbi:hypothetical protein L209DRAFT_307241 [Thermothelomyces heterothallicus CBS 203.75]